ncbi:MAG: putative cGMP-dependent protein kinase [Monoraphidium minutum]|nr:MAG: putative cGMP-dependent protein kinase [Monoraphidium minutum]
MQPRSVGPGKDVIRQGDVGATEFFVLESGAAEALLQRPGEPKPRRVAAYGPGGSFGELALLYSAPRAATVRTTAPAALWVAERAAVMRIKRQFAERAAAAKLALIERVPMFGCLTDQHKALLAGALEQVTYAAGDVIMSARERGELFFIIKEGSVALRPPGAISASTSGSSSGGAAAAAGGAGAKLGPGEFFGERALLAPGAALGASASQSGGRGGGDGGVWDYVAESPRVSVLAMKRAEFERLLGPYEELWRYEVLRRVPILFALSDRQLWQLARLLQPGSYRRGETVFRAGDAADSFYIVQAGAFTCFTNEGKELARVGAGQCFGELALLHSEGRAANVMALEDAQVLTLHRDAFHTLLGRLDTLRHMWRFEALRRVPLLRGLPDKARAELAAALTQLVVPKGAAAVTQGEEGHAFYIVESGQLAAFKDGGPAPVMAYGPGDFFGELAMIRPDSRRAATVRARSDATLLALERSDFHRLLGPLVPALAAAAAHYKGYVAGGARIGGEVLLTDLQQLAVLGAGGFGRVTLVKHQAGTSSGGSSSGGGGGSGGGGFYALKQMTKAYIKAQGLVRHVHREKQAMLEVDSPWLVNLAATLKDERCVYMLLEAVLGGELFAYLQTRRAPLPEPHARFYAASVILALEALHGRNLVYRDLKPENLLIGEDGYVKMADFGFVKKVLPGTRTNTLCGTPEYLAPEIIAQEGHWQAADWWSTGVLIFELVSGACPFYSEDRMAMYRLIVAADVKCPSHFSPELCDLVRRLLVRRPALRLGAQAGGADDVKRHPWFAGFDWAAFEARSMKAPYLPKVSHPGDSSNFRPQVDDSSAGGVYRNQPYKTTGEFSNF